jgi:hypothetical protein
MFCPFFLEVGELFRRIHIFLSTVIPLSDSNTKISIVIIHVIDFREAQDDRNTLEGLPISNANMDAERLLK